jgi:hypothetical protein
MDAHQHARDVAEELLTIGRANERIRPALNRAVRLIEQTIPKTERPKGKGRYGGRPVPPMVKQDRLPAAQPALWL